MFTGVAVLAAAFASLATTDVQCPQAASLSDSASIDANASRTTHYVVNATVLTKLHVTLRGTSPGAAEARVRLEPDDPSLFGGDFSPADASPTPAVELSLRQGTRATAELELPHCREACSEVGLSVAVEHVSGDAAELVWEVIAETESCEKDFHVLVERR